jgi:benzylsuccinate CoA-transferase BbsF subunit
MGSPEWTLKEEFSSAQHRKEHAWEVYKHSSDWSIHQKKADVFKMAQEKKVPCFPVGLISDLPKMEQLDHRAFWVDLDHSVIRGFKYPGLPMKTNTESVPSRGAPLLGEHTFEVCQKLETISSNRMGRPGLDLLEEKGIQRMIPNALSGIRVVDFSWVVAGPFCTKLLGLMGAEVIKIESSTRPQYKNRGAWFSVINNSKKSCTINLATDEGKDLVKKIIARSDMVVENFSTGVMDRLGLGYSELCKIKEDIIFISASGLGRTGPGKDYLAYGSLLQGLSGWTSLFNKANPSMEAMGIFPAWTDPNTGLWELLAILTALYHRARTGKGLYVDLSMLESTITLMPDALLDFIANAKCPIPGASCFDTKAVPHGYYPCKENDSWIAISVSNQSEWKALCNVMGDPSWCHAEGLESSAHRLQNQQQIDKHLSEWTVQFPMQELFERLQSAGIPAGPCYNIEQLIGDPHFKLRGLFARLDLGKGKTQITTTLPWQDEEEKDWKGDLFKPPDLGEHNEYVFLELLQLTREEFEKYRSMGVIE